MWFFLRPIDVWSAEFIYSFVVLSVLSDQTYKGYGIVCHSRTVYRTEFVCLFQISFVIARFFNVCD